MYYLTMYYVPFSRKEAQSFHRETPRLLRFCARQNLFQYMQNLHNLHKKSIRCIVIWKKFLNFATQSPDFTQGNIIQVIIYGND